MKQQADSKKNLKIDDLDRLVVLPENPNIGLDRVVCYFADRHVKGLLLALCGEVAFDISEIPIDDAGWKTLAVDLTTFIENTKFEG